MNLITIISELYRFIRDHLIKILIGTLAVATLIAGGRYYLSSQHAMQHQDAYNYLKEIYSQEPAELQFIVTTNEGELFGNSFIFDEYFSQPQWIKRIEQETGIQFGKWLESEQELGLFKTPQFRGGLAAIRNSSSDVMTLRVLVAPTAQENLTITQAIMKLVENEEVAFLNHHNVTFLEQPMIGERLDLETNTMVATPESLSVYAGPNVRSVVLYGVLGLIAGFILTVGVLFLRQLSRSKISYGFDYAWELEHMHVLYNPALSDAQTLLEVVQTPPVQNRVVIAQNAVEGIATQSTLSQTNQELNEIVVLIQSGDTTKQWYKDQMVLSRLYRVPVKIIHIV